MRTLDHADVCITNLAKSASRPSKTKVQPYDITDPRTHGSFKLDGMLWFSYKWLHEYGDISDPNDLFGAREDYTEFNGIGYLFTYGDGARLACDGPPVAVAGDGCQLQTVGKPGVVYNGDNTMVHWDAKGANGRHQIESMWVRFEFKYKGVTYYPALRSSVCNGQPWW